MHGDAHLCPLCAERNACARAAGDGDACWCFETRVPRALLALVPEEARGERCICRTCIGVHAREPRALLERGRQLLERIRSR
jgi:hypothetical protein